jgi:hypothetical protein
VTDFADVTPTTPSEDAPKRSWDFWNYDDTPVTTFEGVVAQLGCDELVGAQIIANYPYPDAVPVEVMLGAQRVLRS